MIDSKETTISPIIYKGYNCYQTEMGDVGMTKSALADICNVSVTSIDYIIKNIDKKTYAPWLTAFSGHDVILTRKTFASSRGKSTVILRWDFCCAVIGYYQNKDMIIANEVEVFQVVYKDYDCYQTAKGEIGMSKLNLANACGVHESAIDHLLRQINTGANVPHWLTPFINYEVVLTRKSLKGGAPKIILKWDFCCAVIRYYKSKIQKNDDNEVKLCFLKKRKP
jgi:hypothetical protein